jgi:P pilus assembly chaperone PapD
MKQMKKVATLGFVLSSLTFANFANAGGLMVTPSRVNLDEKSTSQEVKLINKGDEVTTYRVSFQHLRMNKSGAYEEIKEGASGQEQFADDVVRFSPKQVTLKPGETQTVRLMFKKSKELAAGEYRSHLLLKEEAPADFGKNVEQVAKKDSKKISVVLKPLFGASIPVVVTNGKIDSSVEIKEAKVKGKNVSLTLARSGNASAYGDLVVTLTDKNTGKKQEVGGLNNVSVFYPYAERDVVIALNAPKEIKLADQLVEVSFYGKNKELATDKEKLLAKKIIE